MQQADPSLDSAALFSGVQLDPEYNGAINRATNQGAKFALLLAMLEQNSLLRPSVEDESQAEDTLSANELAAFSYYRTAPLQPSEQYWSEVAETQRFIAAGAIENARLWLAMHPEPLSLHNNPKYISAAVTENCSLVVRERLRVAQEAKVKQDATVLYDILDDLKTSNSVV